MGIMEIVYFSTPTFFFFIPTIFPTFALPKKFFIELGVLKLVKDGKLTVVILSLSKNVNTKKI